MNAKEKTILIIEDEKPLLNAIKTKLESSGFATLTSRTVKQGLDYLQDVAGIDAIWLDHYLLGSGTGLDFVIAAKKHKTWKKIPIFVVSNTASPSNVHSYIKFGVTKYYTKSDYRLDQIIGDLKDMLQ